MPETTIGYSGETLSVGDEVKHVFAPIGNEPRGTITAIEELSRTVTVLWPKGQQMQHTATALMRVWP